MGEEGGDVHEDAGDDGDIEMKTEDTQEDAAGAAATTVVTPASDLVIQATPQPPASEFTCTMVDKQFKITDKEGKLVAHVGVSANVSDRCTISDTCKIVDTGCGAYVRCGGKEVVGADCATEDSYGGRQHDSCQRHCHSFEYACAGENSVCSRQEHSFTSIWST